MIESTLSIAHLGSLFARLKSLVPAERYAILLGPDDSAQFVFACTHGLEEHRLDLLDTRLIELSVLRRASVFNDEEALASVMCVPLLGSERQVVGIVYFEDRSHTRAFRYTEQLNVENLVKALHTAPAPPVAAPIRPASKARPPAQPKSRLSRRDQVLFLVHLATFVKAGIPLMAGLDALAQSKGQIGLLAGELMGALLKGRPLSLALEAASNFPGYVLGQLRSAEHSGQLALSLELLANSLENQRRRDLKLRAALVYPAFLLLLCLAMAILAPSYLLKSQLEFYQAQKMELPGLSRLLLNFGRLISHPLIWLLTPGLLWGLWRWVKPRTDRLVSLAAKLPVLGDILRMHWECRVLSSLQMLLHSGVGLLEAIPLAVDTSSNSLWSERQQDILDSVVNGEPLNQALQRSGLISRVSRSLLAAGEESGALVSTLAWTTRILENELETKIEIFGKLLEPLVMAFMGVVVGIITLASLLPSIRFIQGM